jgi:NAD(P)-dependent dehydrogenase (short-subunit alcohol dehydrogenase family)
MTTTEQAATSFSSLAGMVILINGGTQGLGEQTARLCAQRGAAGLVLVGRKAALGVPLAAELTAADTPTLFVEADVSEASAADRIMAAADEKFGVVHGLVNVAASCDRGTIFDTTVEDWDYILNINVRAPFQLTQGVARILKREREKNPSITGSIVNIGSTSGYGGQPFLHAYCVSKGALMAETKNAAYSLMRWGVRVNQVNPGWMDTASEDATQRKWHGAVDGWLESAEAGQPMGRLVKPNEVARAIAFLLSPESGLMTGSIIDFDQSVQGAGDAPKPSADETPK